VDSPGPSDLKDRRLAIVAYGTSRSVEKACERVDVPSLVTLDRESILSCDGIVLPGGMSFAGAMQELTDADVASALREAHAAGTPLLGIGIGMQVLFERSSESPGVAGLGLLGGEVNKLSATSEHKVPHVASKPVTWCRPTPLTEGLPEPSCFAHMHSFVAQPADAADILGWSEHHVPFVSAVGRDALLGVQFRPEKSRFAGMALLHNFARLCVPG